MSSTVGKRSKGSAPSSQVTPSASTESHVAPETTAAVKELSKLKPEGQLYTSSSKYDTCAFIIHCPAHNKVLLSVARQDPPARWMPFTQQPPNGSWKDGALVGFCLVLAASDRARFNALKSEPPYESFKCLQVLRLQLPQTQKFITRGIYYFRLLTSTSNFTCCQPIARHLEWFSMSSIVSGHVPSLWSPELVEYCQHLSRPTRSPPFISEFSLDEAFHFLPRDPPRNCEEEMLKSLNITQVVVERVFADWMDHCFPALFLCADSFKHYMRKYGFEASEGRLERLFHGFNYDANGYLSFHEFLLGLACLEQNAAHGEFRAKFIYRYYNTDQSGQMSLEQVKAMVADMVPPDKVDTKLREVVHSFGGTGAGPWSEMQFISAIGNRKLRGTSLLCRSGKAIFSQISRSIAMKGLQRMGCNKLLAEVLIKRKANEICPSCTNKKYEMASHLVSFFIDGRMTNSELAQVSQAAPPTKAHCLTAAQYSKEFVFKHNSAANAVLKLVREFNPEKGNATWPKGLMADRRDDLYNLLLLVYQEIEPLLEAEYKCQKVYSPCYIIGDIHGNIEDLLSMERALWSQSPCLGANYLFLGDYVDRGQWGFECALYLMAFKLLCPNKVTMLRGNHEVRSLNARYSYKKECIIKYGEAFGLKIWELTNRVFDRLPCCAVVDDAIFCAHGGIPHPESASKLEQISFVQRNIREPEDESSIVWEILWSDPCNMQEFYDTCDIRNVEPETAGGFVFNTKRGTAYKFNEEGAKNFFQENLLTHLIRAHEVAMIGYEFHFVNKCVTIFSSSHYCGNDNDCGLILADNQRLRVIHIDTTNNSSATD